MVLRNSLTTALLNNKKLFVMLSSLQHFVVKVGRLEWEDWAWSGMVLQLLLSKIGAHLNDLCFHQSRAQAQDIPSLPIVAFDSTWQGLDQKCFQVIEDGNILLQAHTTQLLKSGHLFRTGGLQLSSSRHFPNLPLKFRSIVTRHSSRIDLHSQ